jgi:hypothetical protein
MDTRPLGKNAWIELFRVAGLDDEAMQRWHVAFEGRYPDAHQAFLAWLGLSATEVAAIRAAARASHGDAP